MDFSEVLLGLRQSIACNKISQQDLILIYADWKRGKIRSPFVRMLVTPESINGIQQDGISTEGLMHFVHVMENGKEK